MDENELKNRLIQENADFKKAFQLHQECETRLRELSDKTFLTEVEEREQKETKKKKLALKDKMYFLITEYKKTSD